MTTLAKKFALAMTATGLAAISITPALAGSDTAARRTMSIAYTDLDLATADGQRTLDDRIERAVRQVCRQVDVQTGTRIMNKEAMNCLARARSEAKQQVAALTSNAKRGG